ncbi:glutamyl-tRNA reductase [Sulfurisphaera tokodaii]|uniref:Glutamyl-tRNA reductase n=2 Tax=Sulfurisphaera tokodaii TaxID=111955 RepID=HEM1_SULTO|nr:glutamyl-tRNA reductase [Sulfurisphaera tokodaii]Q976H4.1 RecName: Full=Glutamyl-tRNA reductase; Short=GluTR [Sulfurisphaera tokodaii str. 7]BAB65173.1 glutamyl-tRNA reductase [Sulfurisphaera tokodaii str. 7]HII74335.1 glutamyl-tRNA reductase [Sulfurisphaera tokodaii]
MSDEFIDINNYIAIVYTYKTVGISKLYEHYVKDQELLLLKGLIKGEISVLQTCNRAETYLYTYNKEEFKDFLQKLDEIHGKQISKDAMILKGEDAVKHLFEVASGLDSLAIGEYEILRQLKESIEKSKKLGLSSEKLEFLFKNAIKVGRKIRQQTEISKGKTGIYALAVEYAKHVSNNNIGNVKIAIVGAGEIGNKLALMLKNEGAQNVTIFNRTYEKALEVANKYGFKAEPLDFYKINNYDIVFVAIYYDKKINLPNPKLVIDLSVPQIVLGNNVITLENLRSISDKIMETKILSLQKAEELIHIEIENFKNEIIKYNQNRLISKFMKRIEDIREAEINRAYAEILKHANDKEEIKNIIDKMTNSMLKKIFSPLFETVRKNEDMANYINNIFEILSNGNISNSKTEEAKEK